MAARISAIIPVFNCQAYLGDAIASILSQSRPPCEIIVVDDGSTDSSAEVARSFGSRVRYVWQDNAGVGAARNKGIDDASGDYLAFLDSDDMWTPRKLELQAAVLDAEPDVHLVIGMVRQFVSPDVEPDVAARYHCPSEPMFAPAPGATLTRQDLFRRAGRFDEQLRLGEWFNLYSRTVDLGFKSARLQETVLLRRIHGGNMGLQRQDSRFEYGRALKAHLDRRRYTGRLRLAQESR